MKLRLWNVRGRNKAGKINIIINKPGCHGGKNALDNPGRSLYYYNLSLCGCAEVVELVDALRSGRSGSNPVGVRVPPSAPIQLGHFALFY
jgi:hypothetical protein